MRSRRTGQGFTLVEATIAMIVVAVLLVAAMRAAGGVGLQRRNASEQATANDLADALAGQILQKAYSDPVAPVFGIESGESSSDKTTFDDVDDFNNWSESPPRDADNTTMSEMTGWTRSVSVKWVKTDTPTTISPAETGLKQITVSVSRGTTLCAQRVVLRSNAP